MPHNFQGWCETPGWHIHWIMYATPLNIWTVLTVHLLYHWVTLTEASNGSHAGPDHWYSWSLRHFLSRKQCGDISEPATRTSGPGGLLQLQLVDDWWVGPCLNPNWKLSIKFLHCGIANLNRYCAKECIWSCGLYCTHNICTIHNACHLGMHTCTMGYSGVCLFSTFHLL